jgi:hypothetical protein
MATSYPASDLNNAEFSVRKAVQFGRLAAENKSLFAIIGVLSVALALFGFEVIENTRAIAVSNPSWCASTTWAMHSRFYLSDSVYKPQAPEVKHFLSDFVTKYYTHKNERLSDYFSSKILFEPDAGRSVLPAGSTERVDQEVADSRAGIERREYQLPFTFTRPCPSTMTG